MLSADHVFSTTLPSPVPVSATGILASCAEEFAKSRELARAVSRADAILVASHCLSPLKRQPQLSDKRWAHGQESFPCMVGAAPTTTARQSSSAQCFRVFCQAALPTLLAVSEDVGSHSESASNNTADNTRVVCILLDMTLVVGA